MSDLSLAQRWILAVAAVHTVENDGDHEIIGSFTRPSRSESATSCLRDWDVQSPEAVREALEDLFAKGTRADYEEKKLGPRAAILGWDLGRAAAVAGWAYATYLIDASAAWDWMVKAAKELQAAFASWAEYGESFARGRDFAKARAAKRGRAVSDDEDYDHRAIVAKLLEANESPWVRLPWRTSLEGATPPLDHRRTLEVVDSGNKEGFSTLKDALAAAANGDRIVIRGGVHQGPFAFEKSLEVIAAKDAKVVLEGDGAPVVSVDDVGVVLSGITIRTRKGKGKEPADAVHSSGGFLLLECCEVTGSRFGIDLLNDAAEVHLSRTRVAGSGSVGVIVEGGFFVARDSSVEKSGDANLQIGGESAVDLRRARVAGAKGAGLRISDTARVHVEDSEISGNRAGGVEIDAEAHVKLLRVKVEGNKGAGFNSSATAGSSVLECAFKGNDGANMKLSSSEATVISNSSIEGGDGLGIHIAGNSKAMIVVTSIKNTALSSMRVNEQAQPTVRECMFEGSGEAALFLSDDAKGVFNQVRIEASRDDAVLVQDNAAGRFVRCLLTRSARAGVRVLGGADPTFERCAIHENEEDGIVVGQGGKGRFVHCDIAKNKTGIYVGDDGSAPLVRGGRVHDHTNDDGIFVGGGSIRLEDCEVFDNVVNLRFQSCEADVARCLIRGAKEAGVYVGDEAKARFSDCDVHANGEHGFAVVGGSSLELARCHVHDNGEDDVGLGEKSKTTLVDGAIGGAAGFALLAEEGSRAKLTRMKIRAGKKGDVSNDKSSKLVLEACEKNAGKDFVIAELSPHLFAPGRLVLHGDGFSFILGDFSPFAAAFAAKKREPNGHALASLVAALVTRHAPAVAKNIRYDPEADTFSAVSDDRSSLVKLAAILRDAMAAPGMLERALDEANGD